MSGMTGMLTYTRFYLSTVKGLAGDDLTMCRMLTYTRFYLSTVKGLAGDDLTMCRSIGFKF